MNVPAGNVIVSPSCAFVSGIACTCASEPSDGQTVAPECGAKAMPKNRAAKRFWGLCMGCSSSVSLPIRRVRWYQDKFLGQAEFSSRNIFFLPARAEIENSPRKVQEY